MPFNSLLHFNYTYALSSIYILPPNHYLRSFGQITVNMTNNTF